MVRCERDLAAQQARPGALEVIQRSGLCDGHQPERRLVRAGTDYYPLEFTNLSRRACYLFGYPGVSALDRNGNQLGSPADWGSTAGARVVDVAPGATAHTVLAYHVAAVHTESGCDPVSSAVDLRVYPPGQRSSTDAAFAFEACSHAGPVWMSIIEPIIAGVGTLYG